MITRLNATPISQILSKIPFWANLSSEEKALVSQRALTKSFNKDQIITSDRSACLGIILILKGGVRISLISDEGREITLYRAHAGEFCVSTASCVIHQLTFEANVSAEEDTTVLVIPSSVTARLMEQNVIRRRFGPSSRCSSKNSTSASPLTSLTPTKALASPKSRKPKKKSPAT